MKFLVTTSIIESDVVPALRAGAAALFSDGSGAVAEYLQRFFVGGLEGLCFSLGRSSYARREAVGGTYILSGAAVAAASEGIFVIIHSCFKDKYFPCGEASRGLKNRG